MQKEGLLVIFTLLVTTLWLPSQITVTNATFPGVGDSLRTATTLNPQGIEISSPGGPYAWDLSMLIPATHQVTVFKPATDGSVFASFPDAEMVTMSDIGTETYYDVSATSVALVGLNSPGLADLIPFATISAFVPPMPERKAPLMFFDINQSQSVASIAIPSSAIQGILDSLGVPSGLMDSIRIRVVTLRLGITDAFGTLAIPGGTYEVLREKRTDIIETRIDAHNPILGWIDVSQLGVELPGVGNDTLVSYRFLSDMAKEPIAVMSLDQSGSFVQQVEYKDNSVLSGVNHVIGEGQEVRVSPNPIFDMATFEFINMVSGHYTLRLFDTHGHAVMVKELTSGHESVSLESLSEGLYFYHVMDGKSKILATGKLLKVSF